MLALDPLRDRIRSILERDRVWSAYALADLSPSEAELSEWLLGDGSVVLIYRGFVPPVLFATGDPNELDELFRKLRPGRYVYTLLGTYRSLLGSRLRPEQERRMWRMVLKPEGFISGSGEGAIRLTSADLASLQELFDNHPDVPDAFHVRQLANGVFFGVLDEGELVSVAGTHVIAPEMSVAAIGNVFTRPDRRGRGFARRATAAVTQELLRQGMNTVVLNVSMDNEPAVRCYRHLGFMPFCGYYEGCGLLTGENQP